MNLILFGFKGCGKTHFGKLLSIEMHRPFIDTDDIICQLYGGKHRVRDIHSKLGEQKFRALEKEALQKLVGITDSIIALGGGAVLDPENVEFLQKIGALVYLHASPELLRKRLLAGELPSFLDKNDPEGSFLRMIHERAPVYSSIPARRIDLENLDEAGVLAALRAILCLEDPPNGF